MFRPRLVEFDGCAFRMAEEVGGGPIASSVPLEGYGQTTTPLLQPAPGENRRPANSGRWRRRRQVKTRRGAVSLHAREIMTILSCRVANTQRQLDDALR